MAKTSKRQDSEILEDFGEIFREDTDPSKIIREIGWFRNILFYLGEQWISWFANQSAFGFRFSMNPLEPTPVSNIIRDYARSMKALIINKKYTTRIWPNSEEQKDRDAAELGGLVLKHLDSIQSNEIEDIKEMLALWVILVGNAFARTYAAKDTGCYIIPKTGKPFCRGDVVVENIIPFNIHVPILGNMLRDKSCVGIKGLKEREWVEDTYKVLLKGGTEEGSKEIEYEKQLMTLVANVSPWKGRSIEQADLMMKENSKLCLMKEMEYKPSMKYPRGRYEVVVQKQVLLKEENLPIKVGKEGDWEYTITEFKYNHTPGSFWATSGIDDLISPQSIINEVDKALASNRKSIGRPYVLTPRDLILKRKSMAGQSFLQLEYDPQSSAGLKPEVNRGTPYPQQVLDERRTHIEVAQQSAGDPKNILRGQAPGSGFSGVSIDILRESAEASHTPDVERFFRAWNRVKKKQLIVAQDLYTETRLIKTAGEGNQILVRQFKGADLFGNTDVRLEIDSGISTTRAGQNEFIMNLIKNNFFGDVSLRPDLQYELMKRMGMSWVPGRTTTHEDRARRENAIALNATEKEISIEDVGGNEREQGERVPVVKGLWYAKLDKSTGDVRVVMNDPYFKYDDHNIHYEEHVKCILGKEFAELPALKQLVLINHADMHNFMIKRDEALQMENMAKLEAMKRDNEEGMKPGQPGAGGGQGQPQPTPQEGPQPAM